MKKILATLLVAMLLVTPVAANWQEEANALNIAYTINAFAPGHHPGLYAQPGELSWSHIPHVPGDISFAWSDLDPDGEIARAHDFRMYMTWTPTHIYVLISTDTRHYFNNLFDGDGNAWQYSAIQWNFANYNDFGGDRLEFGTWRNSENGELGAFVWHQHPDANEFVPEAGVNYTVELRGDRLYYQVIVPVNTFLARDTVSEGDVIGVCFVMAQTLEGGGGHIHAQFASGCTGDPGKDAERFARITLGPALEVPEEEPAPAVADEEYGVGGGYSPEAEAAIAAAAVSPETNDGIVIFASLAIVALIAAAAVKRRAKSK